MHFVAATRGAGHFSASFASAALTGRGAWNGSLAGSATPSLRAVSRPSMCLSPRSSSFSPARKASFCARVSKQTQTQDRRAKDALEILERLLDELQLRYEVEVEGQDARKAALPERDPGCDRVLAGAEGEEHRAVA